MSAHPNSSIRICLRIVSLFLGLILCTSCSKVNDPAPQNRSRTSAASSPQRKQIEERINQLIRKQLGNVTISPESRLMEDLKADELDVVELVMRVEEEFKIEISDDDVASLSRVNDWYDYVERHLKTLG